MFILILNFVGVTGGPRGQILIGERAISGGGKSMGRRRVQWGGYPRGMLDQHSCISVRSPKLSTKAPPLIYKILYQGEYFKYKNSNFFLNG